MESGKVPYDAVKHRAQLEGQPDQYVGSGAKQAVKRNILEEAQAVIYGDREKTYGSPDKNLAVIAAMWNTYLDLPPGRVTVADVCNMMVLLKVSRLKNDPTHRDSMVDICGYTALNKRVQEYKEIK